MKTYMKKTTKGKNITRTAMLMALVCFALAPALLLAAQPAYAQDSLNQRAQGSQQITTGNAFGNVSEACETRQERMTLQITRYQNNYDRNQEAYERVQSIIQSALDNLSARGYDVSDLEADMETMNGYILTFQTQTAAVIGQLETAQSYACGQSEGQFTQAMVQARQMARDAQQTMLTIRTFYQTTIRPDFQALKSQTPDQ